MSGLWRSAVGLAVGVRFQPGLQGQQFVLRRCRDCGTAVTGGSQPAEDLRDSGAFRAGTPRLHALAGPLLERFDARRLELLRRLAPPGARVLDAGAGQGRFVAAAHRAGYDALGLERSQRRIDRGRRAGCG